jgi:hypothetical protein
MVGALELCSSYSCASYGGELIPLNLRILLCICLIAGVLFATISGSNVAAQSCKKVTVSSNYPKQADPNQQVQVSTTIAGSCTSGPEDYFSVRVDVTDGVSKAILSSESAPIGYSVGNFSVTVQNSATTPAGNRTWLIVIDSYLTIDGTQSHLNSTTGMIQVGGTAVPEFQANNSFVLLLAVAATLVLYRRTRHK